MSTFVSTHPCLPPSPLQLASSPSACHLTLLSPSRFIRLCTSFHAVGPFILPPLPSFLHSPQSFTPLSATHCIQAPSSLHPRLPIFQPASCTNISHFSHMCPFFPSCFVSLPTFLSLLGDPLVTSSLLQLPWFHGKGPQ